MLTEAQDVEATRVRALRAALNKPLPHIDAEARRRAVAEQLVRDLDACVSQASVAAGVVAAAVGIGAGVQVVALFVGGVL